MIGARIRQLRGSASQQEFADRLGITRDVAERHPALSEQGAAGFPPRPGLRLRLVKRTSRCHSPGQCLPYQIVCDV